MARMERITQDLLIVVLTLLSISSISAAKPCKKLKKPEKNDKVMTARWLVHTLDWGVVSTISTRTNVFSTNSSSIAENPIVPFGNIFSISDGSCDPATSSGIPYLYATDMDQTMQDVDQNPIVSLTISEASLSPESRSCSLHGFGDPENPPCARLVLTGKFVRVTEEEEIQFGKRALFSRHPAMSYWPDDHEFFVAKIEIEDLWLLDWFGGASILDVSDYFNTGLETLEGETSKLKCGFCQDLASIIRFGSFRG